MSDYLDFFNALSDEDFEERPVGIEEFCLGERYLGLAEISDEQFTCIRASSQIYKRETLISLYGEKLGNEVYEQTANEIILQLGKGSGKDFISTVSCAYIVYLLLCLKDPAVYFKKPRGNAIDILNIAINAVQANNVFFKNFKILIEGSPWFNERPDRYYTKQGSIEFAKNITVHSGHSEREAWEGYNVIAVFLDEISGFALESTSGNEQAKTASAVYEMYRASVNSRFAETGKLVLLSFPRFKDDFIQQRYKENVAEYETIKKEHLLKLDPNLPDGVPGNEYLVRWDHDVITRYKYPKVFALKRATWEVNPQKFIEDYTRDFFENPGQAYSRVACMPSGLESGFFKNHEKIDSSFTIQNGVDADGLFLDKFQPKKDTKYYMHVDLAQKHDHCAVSIAHVDKWVEISVGSAGYKEILPYVVVDAVRWWTPRKDKSVDFKDVTDFIMACRRRGFDIKLCTFDRWNSHDTMNYLERNGIHTDTLSVAKKHYDDFLSVLYDDRLLGPNVELLSDELKELRLIKDKVDHPRKGTKDLSDATCGAIYNAVAYSTRPKSRVVEARTMEDVRARRVAEHREQMAAKREANERAGSGVIYPPPAKEGVPQGLQDWLLKKDRDWKPKLL